MNIIEEDVVKSSFVYEGQEYFNKTNASKYLNTTYVGFHFRIKEIEKKNNIKFPFVAFPTSNNSRGQETYISKKILDMLRQPVLVGREAEWIEKLKQAIREFEQQGE